MDDGALRVCLIFIIRNTLNIYEISNEIKRNMLSLNLAYPYKLLL